MRKIIEQEIASIIKFILDSTDSPKPYYYKVPQDFRVPSVYFPPPEVMTGGDTLSTYYAEYAWFIKFFAKTDEAAYEMAMKAATAIKAGRNVIPYLNFDWSVEKQGVRITDASVRMLDDGAAQLSLVFTSRRPYNRKEAEKTMRVGMNFVVKRQGTEPDSDAIIGAMGTAIDYLGQEAN